MLREHLGGKASTEDSYSRFSRQSLHVSICLKISSVSSGLCSDERWRKAARTVLGSLEGLNRSQQRAIATAMSSTFTLWQVCRCPCHLCE